MKEYEGNPISSLTLTYSRSHRLLFVDYFGDLPFRVQSSRVETTLAFGFSELFDFRARMGT